MQREGDDDQQGNEKGEDKLQKLIIEILGLPFKKRFVKQTCYSTIGHSKDFLYCLSQRTNFSGFL